MKAPHTTRFRMKKADSEDESACEIVGLQLGR